MSPNARPVAIATWQYGRAAVEAAGKVLSGGGTALDAVEQGINAVELDPSVTSVGLGGRPNREGVVELDAAIMDGAGRAGCVAALRDVARAVSVARKVMEQTPHVMLAGEGARRFALKQGFEQSDLLTEESRRAWEQRCAGGGDHDTVGLVALDAHGHVAAGCSTSGLAWKLPGRVGDSPIIGSGLYADEAAGGAAATGHGEEIMTHCAGFLVCELMRAGQGPAAACQEAVGRILAGRSGGGERHVALIALSAGGRCGAASTRSGFPYAVWRPGGVSLCQVER